MTWSTICQRFGTFHRSMGPGQIDLSYLERLFKGDRARIHGWIQLYLEEAPGQFQRLTDAVARNDAQALAQAAHELRPQAHYLGLPRLLVQLIALAEAARTSDTSACRDLVADLVALGEVVEAELRQLLMAP